MLQNILDANKNVIVPLESKLIIHLKKKYFKVSNWTQEKIDEFITDLYCELSFANSWKVDKLELESIIKSVPLEKLSFSILCKLIYLSYLSIYPKEEIHIIGDKNPTYSLFISDLLMIFPEAKIIHLVRDYRDNIMSNIKTLNFDQLSVGAISSGWVSFNRFIEKEKSNDPDRFLTIKYEDLVTNPKFHVQIICKFLKIKFNNSMLGFNNTISKEIKEGFNPARKYIEQIHPNILEKISTKQINKWNNFFSNQDLQLIEYIIGNEGLRYNYPKSNPKQESYSLGIKYKAFTGIIRQHYNNFIIKLYYSLPMWVRSNISRLSKFLNDNFGYSNYFNSEDFRFKKNINR